MKITEVSLRKMENMGKIIGFADVTFNDCFVVKKFKVINGSNGPFVAMPSEKSKDGEYYDTVFPITKEFRETLIESILEKI